MRLTEAKRLAIKKSVHQFLPDAQVYLYGSRTDDAKRGGDIDLLVLTGAEATMYLKVKIIGAMYKRMGEQKIDLLLEDPTKLSEFGALVFPHALPL
ncbi:MAG TPA: nucleotidyltransferase domain-containing protein [Candidatus Kapabacteria bacterium]|nr:nucleotidyltransferase domain-containing protein [Candidatus Kapabacteria bacterium]